MEDETPLRPRSEAERWVDELQDAYAVAEREALAPARWMLTLVVSIQVMSLLFELVPNSTAGVFWMNVVLFPFVLGGACWQLARALRKRSWGDLPDSVRVRAAKTSGLALLLHVAASVGWLAYVAGVF